MEQKLFIFSLAWFFWLGVGGGGLKIQTFMVVDKFDSLRV